ncbi:hypothetical protein BH20VER1_BH20VER1_05660 [soil metagenome]
MYNLVTMLEEIRKRVRTVPFEPFAIELSSGYMINVPHPDHIAVGRAQVAVEDDQGLFDVVSALHITRLHSQGAASAA